MCANSVEASLHYRLSTVLDDYAQMLFWERAAKTTKPAAGKVWESVGVPKSSRTTGIATPPMGYGRPEINTNIVRT